MKNEEEKKQLNSPVLKSSHDDTSKIKFKKPPSSKLILKPLDESIAYLKNVNIYLNRY